MDSSQLINLLYISEYIPIQVPYRGAENTYVRNIPETIDVQLICRTPAAIAFVVAFSFDVEIAVARGVHYKSVNGLHYFTETCEGETILLRIIRRGNMHVMYLPRREFAHYLTKINGKEQSTEIFVNTYICIYI